MAENYSILVHLPSPSAPWPDPACSPSDLPGEGSGWAGLAKSTLSSVLTGAPEGGCVTTLLGAAPHLGASADLTATADD